MITPTVTQAISAAAQNAKNQQKSGAVDVSTQFSHYLGSAIGQLNQQIHTENALNSQFVAGNLKDVSQLTIASEKALLGLNLAVQVRDKVIGAYQAVMNMQV